MPPDAPELRLCRARRCWQAAGIHFFAPSQAAATGNPGALRNDRERERESEVPFPRLVTSLLPPFFFFFPVPIKNLGLASNFPAKAQPRRRGGGEQRAEPGGLRPCPSPAARPLPAPGAARCPRAGRARWAPGHLPPSCPAGTPRSVLPADPRGTCASLEK